MQQGIIEGKTSVYLTFHLVCKAILSSSVVLCTHIYAMYLGLFLGQTVNICQLYILLNCVGATLNYHCAPNPPPTWSKCPLGTKLVQ